MNGIFLIDKPVGVSSFYVTTQVKRKLGQSKVGHAGTLDPMASGVLPVMAGRATKLIDMLPNQTKRYRATMMLGMTTDTLDTTGEVLSDQPVFSTKEDIEKLLLEFTGEIEQIPPMYSALNVGGEKLYNIARRGGQVERAPRKCTIFSIDLVEVLSDDRYVIDVLCSKGTYIRSLIDDIGLKLGCGAVMTALRRTQAGGFSIEKCVSLSDFMALPIEKTLNRPENVLEECGKIRVTQAQARRFSNGGALDVDRLMPPNKFAEEFYRVYDDGEFLGLGRIENGRLKPRWVNEK
jgi:tRNA pseudouridine55 synthase